MTLNKNERCPVCSEPFMPDDDIVICPYCGTPHHRECYNSLGHCFHSDKHNTGFEYSADYESESKDEAEHDYVSDDYHAPVQDDKKTLCNQCGEEINSNVPFCIHCGARQNNAEYGQYNPIHSFTVHSAEQKQYEEQDEEIEGKSVADIAAVIVTNSNRFIPKFLMNKKISWNWSAFIFGAYYYFFRKMYKQGIVFTVISFAASLIISGIFQSQLTEFYNALFSSINNLSALSISENYEQILLVLKNTSEPFCILAAILLILRLIMAVFANRFYRARVIEVLNKIDDALSREEFIENASFSVFAGEQLSKDDMRKLYLSRMGGTSFMAPVAAYFATDFIMYLINLFI